MSDQDHHKRSKVMTRLWDQGHRGIIKQNLYREISKTANNKQLKKQRGGAKKNK